MHSRLSKFTHNGRTIFFLDFFSGLSSLKTVSAIVLGFTNSILGLYFPGFRESREVFF